MSSVERLITAVQWRQRCVNAAEDCRALRQYTLIDCVCVFGGGGGGGVLRGGGSGRRHVSQISSACLRNGCMLGSLWDREEGAWWRSGGGTFGWLRRLCSLTLNTCSFRSSQPEPESRIFVFLWPPYLSIWGFSFHSFSAELSSIFVLFLVFLFSQSHPWMDIYCRIRIFSVLLERNLKVDVRL